ncbi:MAG TPA: hypothetical protein VM056_03080 [Terriglobales bacterium]|nr:hypothetical protein [Terriglobales bacterium]
MNQDLKATLNDETTVTRLAQFFPSAIKVRIPVMVSRAMNGEPMQGAGEETVIEFGTEREVIFASSIPLEFDDKVHLKNVDGSLDTNASVVAVQLGPEKSAVAVRFTHVVNNWIIKRG